MMVSEFTTVVMTYNLWGRNLWPEREPALRAFLATRPPDILAVQELTSESRDVIDEMLPGHERVDAEHPGWAEAGNIWWRSDLYRLVESDAVDIGIHKSPRSLFWVKLTPLPLGGSGPLLVATAHLTWSGNRQEERDGTNPRIQQTHRALEELERLAPNGPCIFLGDFNDEHHPPRILRGAGFEDSFSGLGRSSPITSPVMPLLRPEGNMPPKDIPRVIDYQFYRGSLAPRSSEVAEFFLDRIAPSDHKPVVSTYSLRSWDEATPTT